MIFITQYNFKFDKSFFYTFFIDLGDAQHVSTLRQLHADTRQGLADSLYSYSAQSGLPAASTVKLLDYLSGVTVGTGTGALDDVTLTLVMTVLQVASKKHY